MSSSLPESTTTAIPAIREPGPYTVASLSFDLLSSTRGSIGRLVSHKSVLDEIWKECNKMYEDGLAKMEKVDQGDLTKTSEHILVLSNDFSDYIDTLKMVKAILSTVQNYLAKADSNTNTLTVGQMGDMLEEIFTFSRGIPSKITGTGTGSEQSTFLFEAAYATILCNVEGKLNSLPAENLSKELETLKVLLSRWWSSDESLILFRAEFAVILAVKLALAIYTIISKKPATTSDNENLAGASAAPDSTLVEASLFAAEALDKAIKNPTDTSLAKDFKHSWDLLTIMTDDSGLNFAMLSLVFIRLVPRIRWQDQHISLAETISRDLRDLDLKKGSSKLVGEVEEQRKRDFCASFKALREATGDSTGNEEGVRVDEALKSISNVIGLCSEFFKSTYNLQPSHHPKIESNIKEVVEDSGKSKFGLASILHQRQEGKK
ncbi:hypothetical protein OF83DRAFT_1174910 [Amylostereum chailletii]|nr:hypothetical protein OF83DRAFT_1174910 [Amylostereum chailletii]